LAGHLPGRFRSAAIGRGSKGRRCWLRSGASVQVFFLIFSFCQDFAHTLSLPKTGTAPMIEVEIPHAERAFIEETGTPYDVLRVVESRNVEIDRGRT
jgi:hypothetical protein